MSHKDKREQLSLLRAERMNLALNMIEAAEQNNYTKNHSIRVARIARKMVDWMGLPSDQSGVVGRAGIFHDIGKITISRSILMKEGELSESERAVMRNHPTAGAYLLKSMDMLLEAVIVAQHHELLNGTGYPNGLKGNDIILHARILAVADVFDAMTGDRPYRKAISQEAVLDYLLKNSGILYDRAAVLAITLLHAKNELKSIYERYPANLATLDISM